MHIADPAWHRDSLQAGEPGCAALLEDEGNVAGCGTPETMEAGHQSYACVVVDRESGVPLIHKKRMTRYHGFVLIAFAAV
jgi:hypothetical protein